MDTLYKKNGHPRDKSVKFEEKTHVYTIDNEKGFTSVTSLVHMCFPKFDADKIIDKMMSSWRWKQNKYYGKTKQEIKDEWKKNGTESANAGTNMHLMIEQFYNDLPISVDEDNIEFTYFENTVLVCTYKEYSTFVFLNNFLGCIFFTWRSKDKVWIVSCIKASCTDI